MRGGCDRPPSLTERVLSLGLSEPCCWQRNKSLVRPGAGTATSESSRSFPRVGRFPGCPRAGHSPPVLSAGRSLQTAHLRPQLRLGPGHEGWPGDSGHLHPEPPDQEHERRQLVPDHHSTEPGQPEIRCVGGRRAHGARRSLRAWGEAAQISGWPHSACSDGPMRSKLHLLRLLGRFPCPFSGGRPFSALCLRGKPSGFLLGHAALARSFRTPVWLCSSAPRVRSAPWAYPPGLVWWCCCSTQLLAPFRAVGWG